MRHFFILLVACLLTGFGAAHVSAQLIHQQVPFQTQGDSFYDATGVNWGIRGPGFFANFGGNVVPPFGGFDPNSGSRTNIGFRNGPWSGNLGLSLNQGSSRSNVSTSASLTTTPGYPGSITSQTVRPFVTGVVPIVGGAPIGIVHPPVTSSGQQQLADVRRQKLFDIEQRQRAQWDARQKQAYASFQRGVTAEEKGNLRMARANYQNALRVAEGELRGQIVQRMRARGW